MKQWMHDRQTRWKCKLISHFANSSEHREQANIPRTQLALPPESHASFGWRDFQKDMIPGKSSRPYATGLNMPFVCPKWLIGSTISTQPSFGSLEATLSQPLTTHHPLTNVLVICMAFHIMPGSCHPNIGLISVIIRELYQRNVLLPTSTKVHQAWWKHVLQDLNRPLELVLNLAGRISRRKKWT